MSEENQLNYSNMLKEYLNDSRCSDSFYLSFCAGALCDVECYLGRRFSVKPEIQIIMDVLSGLITTISDITKKMEDEK